VIFRRALFLVLTGLALSAGGCGRRESPAAAGVATQTLLIGNYAEPADLDPQIQYTFTDANISYALFEGLTAIDERTALPVPALAERWDVSPDGLVYTFHLRPTGRWSNGDPVTAADFAFSFRRILRPALGVQYSYMLWPIKNARPFNAGKLTDFSQVGVAAVDDYTLRITLEKPTPYLPALAAHNTWMPVPRATIEKFGRDDERATRWTREGNIVGNGPFVLKQWTPNDRIVVEKNPLYWDAAHVRLQRIVFFPIENAETEELDFRAGQLHATYYVPIAKVPVYREHDPDKLRADPWLASVYLAFNTTRPPLNNVKVRRALTLGMDRDAIVRDVLAGTRTPARSLTPPNCAGFTARAQVADDFAAARQLLVAAGYPGGRGLPVFEIQVNTDSLSTKTTEAIQAMWLRELGVHATITPIETKTLYQNQQLLNYTIGYSGWVGDYADPSTFLNQYLTGGGNNWTGWGNPEFDRMIAAAENTGDNARRYECFQKAEAILQADAPVAPIYFDTRVYLIAPALHGWEPSLIGSHQYKKMWLEN